MKDISVTAHQWQPSIGSQLVAKYKTDRKNGKESLHNFAKIIIRRIKNQVARVVGRSNFSGKPASNTSAIYNNLRLGKLLNQLVIYKLQIIDNLAFATFTCAFAKTAVIDQHHIVIITVKILRSFCP